MSRDKRFCMWMTKKEYDKLQKYAESQEISMAEAVRDFLDEFRYDRINPVGSGLKDGGSHPPILFR